MLNYYVVVDKVSKKGSLFNTLKLRYRERRGISPSYLLMI